jgi:hypothetical protein
MQDPVAGAPSDNTTMTAIINDYRAAGFDAAMDIEDGGTVGCDVCGTSTQAAEIVLDSLRRIEGASDPADMAAVAAVTCPSCGARGVVVARFGPEATPDDEAFLLGVRDRRGADDLPPSNAPGEEMY